MNATRDGISRACSSPSDATPVRARHSGHGHRRAVPARAALVRALKLAAPEKLRRPVIEAPPPLRRFLRQDQDLAERHAWLGALVIGIDTGEKPSGGAAPITPASPIV